MFFYPSSSEYDDDYEEKEDSSSAESSGGSKRSQYDVHEEKELRSLTVQNILPLKACICKALVRLGENTEEGQSEHLEALLIKIRNVFRVLQKEGWDLSKREFAQMDTRKASTILESLELLNPHIQQLYDIISSQSYSSGIIPCENVMLDLFLLRGSIADLMTCDTEMVVDPVKEEHEAAKRRLRVLSNFLCFAGNRCSELDYLKELEIYAESLVWKMSCLFYLCIKMNAAMMNEIKLKMHLSSELHNFSPRQPEVRQICINVLKASKSVHQGYSALVDETGWQFLDFLRDDILELSGATPSSFMASYKGQILSLHEDLQILTATFAMHRLAGHIKVGIPDLYQIHTYLTKQICTIIVDLGCLIYSLHDHEQNEDEAKELKTAVSCLQDTIKIAKEDAKKACHKYVPKPWLLKTKFPKNNEQVTIQFLMKNLDKISDTSNRKKIQISFHQSLVFHKQLESLAGAFSKLIAKQHLDHEELEIQMTRFCNVINKANHLISLLSNGSPEFWGCDFLLFVLLEEIKMIKMEFEDVQKGIMRRKINPQGKQTRIDDTVMISKDEADKMGEQQMDGSKTLHSLVPTNVRMLEIEKDLSQLQNNLDFIGPLKDEIRALKFSTAFLGVFFNCEGKWHIADGNLKVLLTRIWSICQVAAADFSRLWADIIQILPKKCWCLPVNMDHIISSMLARLRLLQPDIQQVYTLLSESPRFITGISEEAVMENLNSLRENIDALLKNSTELVAPLKEELKAVQNRLRFFTGFLGFAAKRCRRLRQLKDLLILAEVLAEHISCLLYLYYVNHEMNDQMVNEMKMHFSSELHKFSLEQPHIRDIYIKALIASKSAKGNLVVVDEFDFGFPDSLRDDILELSNFNISSIATNKDHILSLHEQLKFLVRFFAMDRFSEHYSECDQISSYVFERINAVIIDVGCMIYSLNDDENNEKMARELEPNKKVSDLETIIMDANEDIRKMYEQYVPKSLQSNFPRTNGQGFIISLLQKLKELLNTKADLVAPLRYHIEIVQKELLSLREDFSKIDKQVSQYEGIQHQWTSFIDIAYQIEYVVDSFLGRDGSLCRHKLGLFNVIGDITKIRIELEAIKAKLTDETLVGKTSCLSSQVSLDSDFSKENAVLGSKKGLVDEKCSNKLVILGEEAEKIREQLTNGSRKLHIISIVGMPGIGKTTLADSVFRHTSVTYHFHAQARCSVSQVFDKRRFLLELLQQVDAQGKKNNADDDDDDDDDDLDQKLYKSLKGRRYLILMDDIWNIQAWEDIKASFPDDEIGSRIIFTSRFQDIATKAGLESTKYHLSLLSKEKSWEMLQVKLFGSQSCPPELVSVGRKIAANCMGLPLTIDLVAGFLRVKETKEWNDVTKSLMTLLFKDPEERCRKVLELSYQNLPDALKPCFLYFAAFPGDEYVPNRDLILLWIAEGFIQLEEGDLRSLEDVAMDILNNLISRSLIIVSKSGVFRRVALSGVHDLLHEFVVEKAQEESFLLETNGKARFGTLSSVGCLDQWREQYRLCIYPDSWMPFLKSDPSGSRTRALISFYRTLDTSSLNFKAFKLLTVLYIPNICCPYCPEMFTLVHLRVLAICSIVEFDAINITSKVHKLRNLQSFILESGFYPEKFSTNFRAYLLLDKICKLVRLRHFCFGGSISFRYHSEKIWEMSSLFDNLRTLYHFKASYEEDIERILKLMPNLVELKALFYIHPNAKLDFLNNSDEYIYPFPKLDLLMKLESLEVTHMVDYRSYPCKIININFPPYLKKLVLSNFRLPWAEVSEIGNLDTLEILELKDRAFEGPVWEMIDGHQFPKLKHLTLSNLDIEEWNASEDHLSSLERLHVKSCIKLNELPFCLAEASTLNEIILFHCCKSANNSAKRIEKEHQETGNEQLVVQIY